MATTPSHLALALALVVLALPGAAARSALRRGERESLPFGQPNPAPWRLASRCKGQGRLPDGPTGRYKPQSLIHIPRTGGSTIEDCTDLETGDDRWGVKNTAINGLYKFTTEVEQGPGKPTQTKTTGSCYRQHLPASLMPEVYAQKPERETFCVVRNPYDRIISQHGFDMGNEGAWSQEHKCNAEHLNSYIAEVFAQMRKETNPYVHDCHFLPQAAYAFAWDSDKVMVDRSVKSCQRVLRFETLAQDFDKLMEEKSYPYRLSADMLDLPKGDPKWRQEYFTGGHLRPTKSPDLCAKLKKEDLSDDARRLINEHFSIDFELFGYQKIGM